MRAVFILIPVFFPIAAGAALPLFRFKRRLPRSIYTETAVLLTSAFLLFLLLNRPEGSFTLLRLTGTLSLSFRMDGLSSVFCGLTAFLWPIATFYAFEYLAHEGMENKFFTFYTMAFGICVGIATSANLLTLYLFYELLTLDTIPLVMHTMTKRSIAAGKKYILYSIFGAAMIFVGMVVLYINGNGGLTFVYGGFASADAAPGHTALLIGYLLTFFGFGVKAAVFPLHSWLPDAGVAPTPVTALLHAVAVVKAGAFGIMRVTFFCFGAGLLRGTWAQYTVMSFAVFTIVFGAVMALKEQHIKRRLAYSTISNLSYILFGVTLMTPSGYTAAMAHLLFHGVMKIGMFFVAGAVMCVTHREYIPQFAGLGRKMRFTFITFTLGAVALIGVPLLPGFLSKWLLLTSAMQLGHPIAAIGTGALLLTTLLCAAYLLPIPITAFLLRQDFDMAALRDVHEPNINMLLPFAVLCAAMIYLGLGSSGLLAQLALIGAGAV